jgi:tetratricopeptide (TPR) repeat protein
MGRDEAGLFVDLVQRAVTEDKREAVDLRVIVTMRSQFLGECARFAGFAETINRTQYLVPRMDDDGLMRAVRRPAQMFGADFDAALAEHLIASVRGREDELPLLQHGLMMMWDDAVGQARPDAPVTVDGSVVENAGGLANLLSDHADQVMARVARDQRSKRIVEAVFRALTDVNAEGSAIRRPCAFKSLCAVAGVTPKKLRPILDAFRAPGVSFLAPYAQEPIDSKRRVEISHEALIRCWGKIGPGANAWLLTEFRDGLVWRMLLFQPENFAEDGSSYLSEAVTETRAVWLRERNEAWSERYGGGWPKVVKLVEASREHWESEREAADTKLRRTNDILESATNIIVKFHAYLDKDAQRDVFAVFRRGAHRGNINAMHNLGLCYRNGWGVAKDYANAHEWYQKAANQGYDSAMFEVGLLYQVGGSGVAKDYAKAREWYEKAANKNDPNAMVNIGFLYDKGRGVTKDDVKALEWYIKARKSYENAADKGDQRAMAGLGALYAQRLGGGEGLRQGARVV